MRLRVLLTVLAIPVNRQGITGLTILCTALAMLLPATVSFAQQNPILLDYYDLTDREHSENTLRLMNTGLNGHVCAMIYVFRADQQMAECCGCHSSPNSLLTLSVKQDLTSNPLTGVFPETGVIKIVTTEQINGQCDPASEAVRRPKGGHTNTIYYCTNIGTPGGKIVCYPIEVPSSSAFVSDFELLNLGAQCSFIQILGSGQGICTCGDGEKN